ncbi:predicted protein [Chaetoceros tenuissimus]|uniref:Uncharacterized protein n=1 Tax=Chaetoceros tenuissimus TaxID=426638 RepID=A0AAD3CPY3_9STRA|nr:predicted protein [Chaetoceros tenuissimus]
MKASLALPRKRQRMELPEDVGDTPCRHDTLSTPTSKCSDTIASTIPSMIYTISSKSPSTSFSDDQMDGNISKLKQKEIHSSPLDVMSLEQNFHSRNQDHHEVNNDSFRRDSFLHSNFDTSLLKHDDGNKYRNKAELYDQTQADVSIDLCRTSPISKEPNPIEFNEYRIYSRYSNGNDSSHSSSSAIDPLLSFDSNNTPTLKHNTTLDSTQNVLKSLEMESNASVDEDSNSFPYDENTNSNNDKGNNVKQSFTPTNRNDLHLHVRQPTFESGVSYDDTFDEENDSGSLLSGLSISSNLEAKEASLHAMTPSEKDTRIGYVCQTEIECIHKCQVKDLSYISNLLSEFMEKNKSEENLRKHFLEIMKMNSKIALSNAEAMRKAIASLHNSLDPTIIPDESCYSFFPSRFIKYPNIHHIESLTYDESERIEFTGSVTSDCFTPYIYEEERYISNIVEKNCAEMRDIVSSHLTSFQQYHCESNMHIEDSYYFSPDSKTDIDSYLDTSVVKRDTDFKVIKQSEKLNWNPNGHVSISNKDLEADDNLGLSNVLRPMMQQYTTPKEESEMQLPRRIRFILSIILLLKCLVIVYHLDSYFMSNNLYMEEKIPFQQSEINNEDLTERVTENTFRFMTQLSKICVISTTNTLL